MADLGYRKWPVLTNSRGSLRCCDGPSLLGTIPAILLSWWHYQGKYIDTSLSSSSASQKCWYGIESSSCVLLFWLWFDIKLHLKLQVWAVNAAGQLDTTFTHPEDEGQAEPRNVSFLWHQVFQWLEPMNSLSFFLSQWKSWNQIEAKATF
jgi:hypothetical protein